jgi:hypothetical protein
MLSVPGRMRFGLPHCPERVKMSGLCSTSDVRFCEGFRMPAMTKVAKGRGPASESLQGRNPRGMRFEGAPAYMAI